jgi:hypothetical protein
MSEQAVRCPKCGSTQIHAEKRGYKVLTGFIGSSKIIITCLSCGAEFRPGEISRREQQRDFEQTSESLRKAVGFLDVDPKTFNSSTEDTGADQMGCVVWGIAVFAAIFLAMFLRG